MRSACRARQELMRLIFHNGRSDSTIPADRCSFLRESLLFSADKITDLYGSLILCIFVHLLHLYHLLLQMRNMCVRERKVFGIHMS